MKWEQWASESMSRMEKQNKSMDEKNKRERKGMSKKSGIEGVHEGDRITWKGKKVQTIREGPLY